MDFPTAIRTCLTKYVDFNGRARRSEFWWFALFNFIVSIITNIIDGATNTQIVGALAGLALLLPGLAVAARRLHDTGRSAWWLLLIFVIIIGWIVLLVFYLQDSQPDNEHGPNPKGVQGMGGGVQPNPYNA